MWPDYMKRDTLAARLDLKPGAIDQYVKRGLLPPPVRLGDADLWSWEAVNRWINRPGGESQHTDDVVDPIMEALNEIPTNGTAPRARSLRQVQG